MAITTKMKNDVLNNLFQRKDTIPDTLYIALSMTEPNEDGTNCTEPTVADYQRLEIASTPTYWEDAEDGSISNRIELRFSKALESWTTIATPIKCWAIYDSKTEGNMLFYGSLAKVQEIPEGGIMIIPEHGLVTTIIN